MRAPNRRVEPIPDAAHQPAIRPGREGDLIHLGPIEVAAGAPFRALGMDAIADDPPPSLDTYAACLDRGHLWVIDSGHMPDRPVAYAMVEVHDDAVHLEQVSVHPDHARQGLGRRLIEHLWAWGHDQGLTFMTLCTFADVPWNGPYYRRLGFESLSEDAWSTELRRVRASEAEAGLDQWPRIAMRRVLCRPRIRRAIPADAPALIDFLHQTFAASHPFTLTEPDEFSTTVEEEERLIRDLDWSRGDQFWVLDTGDAIVGSLTATPHKRRKMHHRIEFGMSVLPSFQGRGLGRALLARCLEEARANPRIHKVVLNAIADNHKALKLYRSVGFVEEGRQSRELLRLDGTYADNVQMGLWVGPDDPSERGPRETS